jgi:hypothetical protein
MAVKKRPAPKRLTKPEKLATFLGGRNTPNYDAQRLEWLSVIAEERGILEPRLGLYNGDWVFELAYALAVDMYDGSGRKGRLSATLKEDATLVIDVREMRMKHPNESLRKIAARVLDINPNLADRQRNAKNARNVEALCKRYRVAEERLKDFFGK